MDANNGKLILEQGPTPGLIFVLQLEQTDIGRSANNDLVLADPEISRKHARIVRHDDHFAVEDLGSTNGSFINGQRIRNLTTLQNGDILDLGDTIRLRYETDAGNPVVAPTTSIESVEQVAVASEIEKPLPGNSLLIEPAAPGTFHNDGSIAHEPVYGSPAQRRRPWLTIGCGTLIALLLLCVGTILILDSFQQGRLLYCGPLRPFFELVLGPLGFAPLC